MQELPTRSTTAAPSYSNRPTVELSAGDDGEVTLGVTAVRSWSEVSQAGEEHRGVDGLVVENDSRGNVLITVRCLDHKSQGVNIATTLPTYPDNCLNVFKDMTGTAFRSAFNRPECQRQPEWATSHALILIFATNSVAHFVASSAHAPVGYVFSLIVDAGLWTVLFGYPMYELVYVR